MNDTDTELDPQYRERLRATLHDLVDESQAPPRRSPALIGLALVAAAVVGATAIAVEPWIVQPADVEVACYTAADAETPEEFEGVTLTQTPPLTVADASRLCGALWADGALGAAAGEQALTESAGSPEVDLQSGGGLTEPVAGPQSQSSSPDLDVCATSHTSWIVVPWPTTCVGLGLTPAEDVP